MNIFREKNIRTTLRVEIIGIKQIAFGIRKTIVVFFSLALLAKFILWWNKKNRQYKYLPRLCVMLWFYLYDSKYKLVTTENKIRSCCENFSHRINFWFVVLCHFVFHFIFSGLIVLKCHKVYDKIRCLITKIIKQLKCFIRILLLQTLIDTS